MDWSVPAGSRLAATLRALAPDAARPRSAVERPPWTAGKPRGTRETRSRADAISCRGLDCEETAAVRELSPTRSRSECMRATLPAAPPAASMISEPHAHPRCDLATDRDRAGGTRPRGGEHGNLAPGLPHVGDVEQPPFLRHRLRPPPGRPAA